MNKDKGKTMIDKGTRKVRSPADLFYAFKVSKNLEGVVILNFKPLNFKP